MGDVQEHGMGDGGHEWPEGGLHEGPHRLAPVAVHQTTLLVAVASTHGLWEKGAKVKGENGVTGKTLIY